MEWILMDNYSSMMKRIVSENLQGTSWTPVIIYAISSHMLDKRLNWYAFDLYFLREKTNEVIYHSLSWTLKGKSH